MAGSSSNWFKIPAGPKKGQRVFISNAAIASSPGISKLGKAGLHKATKAGVQPSDVAQTVLDLSGKSAQPAGQAKKGGLEKPSDRQTHPFPARLENLTTVKTLGGSTGAKLAQDAAGNSFVVKKGGNAGHLREEVTADAMYQALGIAVPGMKVYETSSGPTKVARLVEGQTLNNLHGEAKQKAHAKLAQDFAADALLSNWDVIGLGQDNILVSKDGTPWRIDNGGSLRYRAQGGAKGGAFSDSPLELWSLRSKTNPQAFGVFGSTGIYTVAKQTQAIAKKQAALLAATPAELRPRMAARLTNMLYVATVAQSLQRTGADEAKVDNYLKKLMTAHSTGTSLPSLGQAVDGFNPNK